MTKQDGCLNMLFANISQWGTGDTVCTDIHRVKPCLIALCETHVDADAYPAVEQRLGGMGYKVLDVDHAAPSDGGGTSAGILIATKKCNQAGPLDSDLLAQVGVPLHRRWAASSFRLKGASVIIVCLYLFVTEEMSSQNVAILAQLAFLFTLLREPVVLVGGF